jgi:hypothetical protein
MIAEVIPGSYDAVGRKVFRPFDRRRGPRPTFPLGRYVSHPLAVHCQSVEEVRKFLIGCKYVSDKELFDKEEYWQPPEDFEKMKKGDCDDFAFWTWRQFMNLGFDTRVVFGRLGSGANGHAWVEFFQDGKCFLVEPLWRRVGTHLPRLSTLRYHPRFSVAWDGEKLTYFQHHDRSPSPGLAETAKLLPEYIFIWGQFLVSSPLRIPKVILLLLKNFLKGFRWTGKTRRF